MKRLHVLILFMIPLFACSQIINIPADYPTIQQGIDASSDGDTVLVQPDVYHERINFNGKNITLASLMILTQDTSYISQTVIDGQGNGIVATIENGEDTTTVLCGFTITDGNSGYINGGGITCINSSPRLNHLIIIENNGLGGGIYCRDADIMIKDAYISDNSGGEGGGIHSITSSITLINVTISDNDAVANETGFGGGIYARGSNMYLYDVKISDNIAECCFFMGGGGGIYCRDSSYVEIHNGSISNNIANKNNNSQNPAYGGGIWCFASDMFLSNVTISYNIAKDYGGGIQSIGGNIMFDSINRCNIYHNIAAVGKDISVANDIYIDTFSVLYPTQYYATGASLLKIDVNVGLVTQVDADLYVSPEGSNSNSGLTYDDPLKTINHALSILIADSIHPHKMYLSEGIFSPLSNGEIFPINLLPYLDLIGASDSTTVLDAHDSAGVMRISSCGESLIKNITITGGWAYGGGGGILCGGSKPHLENLIISNNSGVSNLGNASGGGILFTNSQPHLTNVIIRNNAAHRGAGIAAGSSRVTMYDVHIEENIGQAGGGVYLGSSEMTIINGTISNNSYTYNQTLNDPDFRGGGFLLDNSILNLQNALIAGNTGFEGGGVYCRSSILSVSNSTIVANESDYGSVIHCYESHPTIVNSILWNYEQKEIYFSEIGEPNSITVAWSDIKGGIDSIVTNNNGTITWLKGNIKNDPLFMGGEKHPFSLSEDSPCIDTGSPDTVGLDLPPWDLIGNIRIWDGDEDGDTIVDMGAYEYGSPIWVRVQEGITKDKNETIKVIASPNPFTSTTNLSYTLDKPSTVTIRIFNPQGQLIEKIEQQQHQGEQQYQWNAEGYPSGMYYYRIQAGEKVGGGKMVKMK